MTNPKRPEDLSEHELRRLLLDKRQSERHKRLEQFRRTGRAISLSPDPRPAALDKWRAQPPLELNDEGPDSIARRQLRRRWFDGILLGIEILAVLGLAGLVYNWFGQLKTLNQEVATALRQDTPTFTPVITEAVLPGGHMPPPSAGEMQLEGELPELIRPLAQSIASLPTPTQGPVQAIRIQIPAINVDAPIVQGDSWEQLKKGVGQHIGSADPGQVGNVVLSAHDDVFGEIFRDLGHLQPGDQVLLSTEQQQYVYIVTGSQIVEPTQVDVMNATSDPTATLISCYPYMIDNKRIVVFAKLQNP